MSIKKFYLWLPVIAVLAFGSVSFAQEFDREVLKAELRAELKAELKKELMAEVKSEILSETKADVQRATEEATLGLKDVMRSDFKAELRTEIMEETRGDISSEIEKALGNTPLLGGMFRGVTVGGFIDANYMYNLRLHGDTASRASAGGVGTGGSPINFIGENENDTFVIENFAMFLDKEVTDEDPIGWQAHLYWGEKAKTITFLGDVTNSSNDVSEADNVTFATANMSWKAPVLGKNITLTFGKFYTWIGYELVENIGNPNYSHGFVYNNWIPFTHTGLSADVSEFLPSDKLGLKLYYVNGWDSFIDNNESKSIGFYATYTPNDDFFISLGMIHGSEGWGYHIGDAMGAASAGGNLTGANAANVQSDNNNGQTTLFDVVATYSLPQIEKLSLGFNFDWGHSDDNVPHDSGGPAQGIYVPVVGDGIVDSVSDGHWWAAVGYAMYDFTDAQQGALRYEYADDTDGVKGFGYSMWSLTYTQNMKIRENLMIRPEIRYNHYANDVVVTERGVNAPEVAVTPAGLDAAKDKSRSDSETIIGVGVEYVF
jgi:hypothetical protein